MIGIIDYGMGNVTSVRNAFSYLGFATILSDKIPVLDSCAALVLPGVGAFGSAVDELQRKGLFEYLKQRQDEGSFILGICLGLQLFFARSEEDPESHGLAFFPETIRRFPSGLKVPHMGWNRVVTGGDPIFQGISQHSYFYFAHSYYASLAQQQARAASCRYGVDFAAAVREGNTYGLQFHPEKSGEAGLKLLLNFGRLVEGADHTGN